MQISPWLISAKYGFLTGIRPIQYRQKLQNVLPELYFSILQNVKENQSLQQILAGFDLDSVNFEIPDVKKICRENDRFTAELLFGFFGYLASARVGMGHKHIPASISKPLVALGEYLQRPPMLSYTGMVLANWRLIDETRGFIPENIDLLLRFTDLIDESWFFRVHIAIEAQAGEMLQAMRDVRTAIAEEDNHAVQVCLRKMQTGLVQITKTFHKMPDLCDPDIYFQQVRPFLMSFGKDIIYEGIRPNPTPLRGGSGAQSSIVPAMLAGLGIGHHESELTVSLNDMRAYMPREHREFIAQMRESDLRDYCKEHPPLRDAYNHVLRQLITFRRAHLYYARTYIFEKSTNPVGTGGTEYMSFLSKLIDETAGQLL